MTNADKFKQMFGLYATELWSKTEGEFLAWLNSDFSQSDVPDMNVGDTVSRQAAIDAVHKNYDPILDFKSDGHTVADSFEDIINALPSAQPERSEQPESAKKYCEECDHIEMCRWYPFEGCEFRSFPSAESERKKGEWIYGENDGQDGWYCSKCGFFIPWYYEYYGLDNIDFISDYHTCPKCDANMIKYTGMRGEQDGTEK